MLIAALCGVAAFLVWHGLLFAVANRRKRSGGARRLPPAPLSWRPNYEKVRRIERQLAAATRARGKRKAAEA